MVDRTFDPPWISLGDIFKFKHACCVLMSVFISCPTICNGAATNSAAPSSQNGASFNGLFMKEHNG